MYIVFTITLLSAAFGLMPSACRYYKGYKKSPHNITCTGIYE